jgi:hypothetical protein
LYDYNAKLWAEQIPTRFRLDSVGDEITMQMEKTIATLQEQVQLLEKAFFTPSLQELSDPEANLVSTVALSLPFLLPVAIAGRSDFLFVRPNSKRVVIYLSVLPEGDETTLLFSTPASDDRELLQLLSQYRSSLEMLSLVEQWMIFGTDYWYLDPRQWESYTPSKKARVLEDLKDTSSFPTRPLPYGLFDSARREVVTAAQQGVFGPDLAQVIMRESEKLEFDFAGPA